MPTFRTSQGRLVPHCHLGEPPECAGADHSASKIAEIRDWMARHHPNAVETNVPTKSYNCIGFALAASHGWFNDYQSFYTDDYTVASFASPAIGDVVEYRKGPAFTHVALVTGISGGQIIRVRSKWAQGPEVSHHPNDHLDYGDPAMLLRPRPGVGPFLDLIDVEEASEPTDFDSLAGLKGGEEMPEFQSTEEAIQWAVERISDPDVYIRVNFASTPDAARVIIGGLPGVKELIDAGSKAAPAIQRYLESAEEQQQSEMSSIALYLLQRIPVEEAKKRLAESFSEGKFTGLNLHLAADALLTSEEAETASENSITAASRAAEKIRSQE